MLTDGGWEQAPQGLGIEVREQGRGSEALWANPSAGWCNGMPPRTEHQKSESSAWLTLSLGKSWPLSESQFPQSRYDSSEPQSSF